MSGLLKTGASKLVDGVGGAANLVGGAASMVGSGVMGSASKVRSASLKLSRVITNTEEESKNENNLN